MTPLDSPSPKTIFRTKNYNSYLVHSQSYDRLKNRLIFPIGAIVIFFRIFLINTLNIEF